MNAAVHLRPVREDDLPLLTRDATDPEFSAPYGWRGFRSPDALRRRWEEDGLLGGDPRYLAVAVDDRAVGVVTWHDPQLFGRERLVWEIGIVIAPEERGQGVGSAAQRLLAEYLFDTTPVHRISAYTEADNVAEQRALEKAGFRREGVLRRAGFRGGRYCDAQLYALLREEL